MGGSVSIEVGKIFSQTFSHIVDEEKVNWVRQHELIYNHELRKEQLALLPKFREELKTCYRNNYMFGVVYQHWYVTDGTWVMEFGGGELSNASIVVHCIPKTKGIIEETFVKSLDVVERMKKLCGATNYSLALRNCEHAAR